MKLMKKVTAVLRLREVENPPSAMHVVELLTDGEPVHLGYVKAGAALGRKERGETFWPTLERAIEDLVAQSASWFGNHLAKTLRIDGQERVLDVQTAPFELNGERYSLSILKDDSYVFLSRSRVAESGARFHDSTISIPKDFAEFVGCAILAMSAEEE